MVIETSETRVVRAQFPLVNHVAILGLFNHWSTTATPMAPVGNGLWEASLIQEAKPDTIHFFVWDRDRLGGRVSYDDGMDRTPPA